MPYTIMRRTAGRERAGDDGETPFVIEESTAHLVSVASRLFSRALAERFEGYEVSVGQWSTLLYLWEEDGLTQKELSRRLQIEEPTAARTLERMERDGLIARERDAVDRRKMHVFLTPRGRALREDLVPCAQEVNGRATHGLSDDDKARVNNLLSYVIARLT